MTAMMMYLRALIGDRGTGSEDGQTMVEYGLILAGIALIVVTTVFLLGGAVQTQFQGVLDQLTGS